MNISPGLLFQIVIDAGIALRGQGDKRALRCPFHEDGTPSAFVSIDNVFFCSVCTLGKGWTAKRFCEEIGLPWAGNIGPSPRPAPRVRAHLESTEPKFPASEALAVWSASLARGRDDELVERDRNVHDYIAQRGLGEALELGAYGVLPTTGLHPSLGRWPGSGHRVVAPLFTMQGGIASIQARSVVPNRLKTVNPKGSRVAGTVFADRRGQRVLTGECADRVVFGEGLTDMLALAITSPWPVLTAPGTSNAVSAVGAWAGDAEVLLALDCDGTGEEAVLPVSSALYAYGARHVLRVRWPRGLKDACEFLARRGDAELCEWLASRGSAVAL